MQSLTTIGLPFGKVTKWLTTHVDSITGHIFCQLSEPSISVKYERLYQAINGWGKAGRLAKLAVTPLTGDLCLVQTPENKKWYRSQITHVNIDDNEVEIYALDYGFSANASFNDLYELPTQFVEVHPHAYECKLADVEPVLSSERWSEKAVELINELTVDQELPGIPVRLNRNILVLKLFADNDAQVTVANQLISAGYGIAKDGRSTTCNSSVSNSIVNTNGHVHRSNSVSSLDSNASSKKSSSSSPSSYKNFQINEEQFLDLCVIYCESLSKFYCQPVSSANELIALQQNIQQFYSSSRQNPIKCKINQPCCAKFNEDEMWYRGIVKRINQDSCLVYFVDYGNTASVVHSDIKEITPDLISLPAMAIECSLNGIVPLPGEPTFNDKAKESFELWTMDNTSMVGFVSKIINGKADLILYDNDDQSVGKKLVMNGLVNSSSPKGSKIGSIKSIDISTTHSAVNENSGAVKYVELSFRSGQEETCYVTLSYTPDCFYINLLNSKHSLDQLMADIAQHTKTNELRVMKNPGIGLSCLIMFSEDNCYYRGEIIALNGNEAEIFFVDYGNKETKQLNELKTIMKEFIKVPKQAIKCKLDGISPINGLYDSKACGKFEELTLDKNLLMTMVDSSNGLLTIDLIEENANNAVPRINIAISLISSGLVVSGKSNNVKVDRGAKIASDSVQYKELNIELNCFIDVAPVDVHDPSQFCCHVVQNAVDFKKLTEELNEFYFKLSVDWNLTWKKMMPCVALYREDSCWYRALIVGSNRNETFEVTFVDFGNSAVVSKEEMRPIFEDFMTLPAQVFVCAIANISPKDTSWTVGAIEGFQNFVKDKHLTAFIKSRGENNLFSVVLYDTRNSPEVNIGQWLIQMDHAVSAESEPELLQLDTRKYENIKYQITGSTESSEVYVTAVTNPGRFWVQLTQSSAKLDAMMEEMYTFYSSLGAGDLSVVHPIIGQYCCAKFTEDEGWYRAIIEEVHGKNVHVRYVDYGNSETVTTDSIKVLADSFVSICTFATQCHLSGLEAYPSWDQSVNALLLDKTFTANFINDDGHTQEVELLADGKNVSDKIKAAAGMLTPAASAVINECGLKVGTQLKVTLLHASTPHDFYCQVLASRDELVALEKEIAIHVTKPAEAFHGGVGSYCLAKSSELNKWCRAEVFDVSNRQVSVQFVDYGNEETLDHNSIIAMPLIFTPLPRQAILCSLSYLKPTGDEWTNGAIELLQSEWANKPIGLAIESVLDGKYDVRAFSEQGGDLGAKLVEAGLARGGRAQSVCSASSSSSKKVKNVYLDPDVSMKETAYVTFVNSALMISIQLQKFEDAINKVMEVLATICPTSNMVSNPTIGTVCGALFPADNTWYRAEVTSIIDSTHAKVLFIDYGNEEIIEVDFLRQLSSNVFLTPKSCITCSLHDVHEADIDLAASKKWLDENLVNQLVTVDFDASTFDSAVKSGTVYIEEGNTINDQLYINFELEVPAEAATPTTVTDAPAPAVVAAPVPSSFIFSQPELSSDEGGYCTFISSPTCLCIQLNKYENDLNAMMETLSEHCANTQQPTNIAVGLTCAALYSVDEGWYRAEVTNVDGSNVTVYFVDYGNTESVPLTNLRQLSAELVTLPRACFLCQLTDVHLKDLDVTGIVPWLQENIVDRVINVTDVLSNDGVHEGYVFANGAESNVNDMLYEYFALEEGGEEVVVADVEAPVQAEPVAAPPAMVTDVPAAPATVIEVPTPAEVALPVPTTFTFTQPELSSAEGGYCTFVSSPTCLCIQLNKYENDLNAMMETLSAHCANTQQPTNIAVGLTCAALYSVDEGWYRAEVTKVDGSNVTVYFVDYGNTESVPLTNLRQLSAELVTLPRACFLCQLTDVHLKDLDVTGIVPWLQENIVDRVVNVTDVLSYDGVHKGYVFANGAESNVNDMLYDNFALEEGGEEVVVADVEAPIQAEPVAAPPATVTDAPAAPATVIEVPAPAEVALPVPTTFTFTQPELSSAEGGYCTFVSSPTCLCIQLNKYENDLNGMMETLSAHCANAQQPTNIAVGLTCAALYSVDEGWYRAEVTNVDGNNATVYFVDYGNTESVPLTNLRQLSAELVTLPRACFLCQLTDVHLKDLDVTGIVPWLQENIVDRVVNVTDVLSYDGVHKGYVFANGAESNVNDMLYDNFALEEGGEEVVVADVEAPIQAEPVAAPPATVTDAPAAPATVIEVPAPAEVALPVPTTFTFTQPELSSAEGGYCTFVSSPTCLCIQLNKYENDLNGMMETLSAHCANAQQPTNIAVGLTCAALYSVDEGWYRAEVTNVDGNNATVYFVDYGNTECVPLTNLRQLSAELVTLPRACFLCQLIDVHLKDLDAAGIVPWLQENVVDQVVNVTDVLSNDGFHEGYVFANGSESTVNDMLYESFALEEAGEEVVEAAVVAAVEVSVQAEPTPAPPAVVTEAPAPAVVATPVPSSFTFTQPELLSAEGGCCTFVSSPTCLCIQLNKYENDLNAMMETLSAHCANAQQPTNIAVGLTCAALYSVDEGWYRAEVTYVDGNYATVYFVDYGNTESVPLTNLRQLSAELVTLPRACFFCQLTDVHLKDLDVTGIVPWLQENVVDQVVNVTDVISNDGVHEGYVFANGSESTVNDMLYENFALEEGGEEVADVESSEAEVLPELPVADAPVEEPAVVVQEVVETPPAPSAIPEATEVIVISPPELREDTIYPATCFVVESAVTLRCQLSLHTEQLDQLMEKITDSGESSAILENPASGNLCLAKCSLDEGWYRGRILENGSVEFIDYGNSEKVSADNIRVIAPEFTTLAQACLTTTLHDVHLADIDVDKAKAWLDENLLEQVVNVEVISLSNPSSVEAYVYYSENNVNVNDLMYKKFPLGVEEISSDAVIVENAIVALPEDTAVPAAAKDDDASSVSSKTSTVASKTSTVASKTSTVASKASTVYFDSDYVLIGKIDLPLPDIVAGSTYDATCFVTESAITVKCQLASYIEKLDELMIKIFKSAEQAEVLAEPKAEQLCLAKFSVDDGWYRGKILEDGSVEFIDYGNGEIVDPSNIRVISAEFVTLPQTCISVTLHDVHMADIDADQTKTWLEESLLEQEVKLEIVSISNPCSVEAYVYIGGSDSHINDQIYELFAQGEEEAGEESAVSATVEKALAEAAVDTPAVVENGVQNHVEEAEEEVVDCTDLVIPPLELCANTVYQAVCYDVTSATQLTFQLLTYQDKLKELMIQMTISGDKARVIKKPVDGMLCMTKHSRAEGWYRARIVEDGTKIQYLDYGNIEPITHEIRQLLPEFILLPQSSVSITLHDVNQDDVHVKASKYWLKENLLEREVKLEVIDVIETNNATAYVYQKGNETHVNDHIYEQFSLEDGELEDPTGSAVTTALNSTELVPSHDSEVVINGTANVSSFSCETYSMPLLTVGGKEEVVFTVVDNASALKCQLVKYREKLERMMKTIADEVENQPSVRFLERGDACIAQWEDLTWYRARVLSTSESTVRVEFVDYGNEDDIITEDLRVIKPEILADHVFCITCQLKDVDITEENEEEILDYLSRTFVEEAPVVSVLVNEVDYDNENVMVTIFQDGVNINEYLQTTYGTLGNVYRCRDINLSEKINVFPLKATSLAEFTCQYADSADELDIMMEKLSVHYKNENSRVALTTFEVGTPCCVCRDSDLTWYRGSVTQVEPSVQIKFVDYGFTEEADSKNIYELKKVFLRLDIQSLQCRLFNLLPEKDFIAWSVDMVDRFNAMCDGKRLTGTVINSTGGVHSVSMAFENGETVYESLKESC